MGLHFLKVFYILNILYLYFMITFYEITLEHISQFCITKKSVLTVLLIVLTISNV